MVRQWVRAIAARGLLAAILALLATGCGQDRRAEKAQLVVAVAASAAAPVAEIAEKFERDSGIKVTVSSASSGTIEKQIREGAPFDLFLSADKERPAKLADDGMIARESLAEYARGALVVWWPASSSRSLAKVEGLAAPDWADARIALANPEHAPYGKAAREALQRAGIWSAIESRVVYGEDVAQVRTLAETGNVDAALLPRGLLPKAEGRTIAVPGELHEPVGQWLGVLARTKFPAEAARLREAILSSREVWERAGFDAPPH